MINQTMEDVEFKPFKMIVPNRAAIRGKGCYLSDVMVIKAMKKTDQVDNNPLRNGN